MSNINKNAILKLAKTLRLKLSDDDVNVLIGNLDTVIDSVETLKKIDTKDVVAMSHVTGLKNVLREDVPSESLKQSDVFANASNRQGGYFVIKDKK